MYDTKEERALMYLPDHRAWSAPYWHEMGIGNSQPQHTNGGNHYFVQYTDANGNYNGTEFVSDTIISSGPTYAELKMDYITDDRKMQVSHTHMEMPQNDENRTYYTIEYKVLEDISIKDFRQNFSIYSVSEKTTGGYYRYIGYLDKENKYAYADSLAQTDEVSDGTQVRYDLGNIAPYFSFFYIPEYLIAALKLKRRHSVIKIFPRHLNRLAIKSIASRRVFDPSALVDYRLDLYSVAVKSNAKYIAKHPLGNRAEGIVVEAVTALFSESAPYNVAIPTLGSGNILSNYILVTVNQIIIIGYYTNNISPSR